MFNFMSVSRDSGSVTKTEFAKQAGNLNLLLCAAGVKVNVAGNLLISANAAVFSYEGRHSRYRQPGDRIRVCILNAERLPESTCPNFRT